MFERKPDAPVVPHDHLWSAWFPHDRKHVYRHCLLPECRAMEKRDVSKV